MAQSRHAQCADEMSAFGSRRTLTNRCFPISIYELHGLEHTATPSRLAHQIAHQTHLAFPRLSARIPGKPENPWGSKGQENSGNTFGNALANRRLQPLGHVSAKANQLVAVLPFKVNCRPIVARCLTVRCYAVAAFHLGEGCHMTRITIGVLICSAFALTLTVQGANSASLNTTSVLKESIIAPDILQNVHLRRCVTNCHWGWYRAGNGKIYTGCHRNDWSCAWASPCNPKACRWWWRRPGA
jgi:hypothetical protein